MEIGSNFHLVYDILVEVCGAPDDSRDAFIQEMTSDKPTTEWRFQGFLGFGGKYWLFRNKVNCYSEDETPERKQIIASANERLRKLSSDGNR